VHSRLIKVETELLQALKSSKGTMGKIVLASHHKGHHKTKHVNDNGHHSTKHLNNVDIADDIVQTLGLTPEEIKEAKSKNSLSPNFLKALQLKSVVPETEGIVGKIEQVCVCFFIG